MLSIEEKIIRHVQHLPTPLKVEVLDFVEYLRIKTGNNDWSNFSLSTAMTGMEDEPSPYSLQDIMESFS
ncbi:MAG: hypothetical protein AB7S77_01655 [Desulfatirhabdiaceae bacterium]